MCQSSYLRTAAFASAFDPELMPDARSGHLKQRAEAGRKMLETNVRTVISKYTAPFSLSFFILCTDFSTRNPVVTLPSTSTAYDAARLMNEGVQDFNSLFMSW